MNKYYVYCPEWDGEDVSPEDCEHIEAENVHDAAVEWAKMTEAHALDSFPVTVAVVSLDAGIKHMLCVGCKMSYFVDEVG